MELLSSQHLNFESYCNVDLTVRRGHEYIPDEEDHGEIWHFDGLI